MGTFYGKGELSERVFWVGVVGGHFLLMVGVGWRYILSGWGWVDICYW